MRNGFNLEDFKRLKIGMDESIDGCGNCMHAMMQRKLYL